MSSRRPSIWWSVALLAGVVTGCLLAAEGTLRLFYPQSLSGSWMYLDDEGNMINRSGGWVRHQIVDQVAYYHFNSSHQRGREDPEPGASRVLVLGDSFTFGWGLQEDQTYIAFLQRNLDRLSLHPRIQLLNAATGGWGTADEVAYLRKFGDAVAPQGVIVFVSFDDFRRALRSKSFRVDPTTEDIVPVDTARKGSSVKKLLQESRTYNWLLEHSHLVQLLRHAIVFGGGVGLVAAPGPAKPPEAERHAEKDVAHALFRWIKRWSDERQVSLVVLTTGWYSIDYPWLAGEMNELGIRFFDLGESVRPVMLRDGPLNFFIPYDGHPNARGARLIGEAAWRVLEPWFKDLNKPR